MKNFLLPVLLTRIKTDDGIILDGIAILPRRQSDTALIWIHGLGSNFSHGQPLTKELSRLCTNNQIAYFNFNTRGHDVVNRDTPSGKGLQGAGFEKFEECVVDIRAMIRFARQHGYKKIILGGHSTGANKALYYLYQTRDRDVKGLILLGAVSDISAGRKKFGIAGHARGVTLAEALIRKNPQALMPQSYGIISAARFLSMFRPGETEDVFPYLDPTADWKELKSIRVPLAVIFGSRDEYMNQPTQKLIEIFRAHAPLSRSFSGVIIKGADHGFKGKEKELSQQIIHWVASNGL